MQPKEYIEDLRALVEADNDSPLAGMSFYKDLVAGKLTPEQVKMWALNMFYVSGQHIRAMGGIFLNTGLDPLDVKIRRHIVENLIDEETDLGRGDEPHWKLAMRLAKALRATDEEIMHPHVAKESVDYVDWIIELGRNEYGAVTLAAMSIGGETRSDAGAKEMLKSLQENYGLTKHDLGFFYAHMGEAEAHGEPVFDMVAEYATTEDRQEAIREQIRVWCKMFRASQDGGYRVALGLEPGVQVHLS